MANQIIVTDSGNVQVAVSPPANVQVQISRAVIGTVANVASANYANYAGEAFDVALANVSGAGNIASINLTGSTSNVLYGNGVFAPVASGNTANANYANFAGTAFSVSGSNVTGSVANATYANIAGVANSVSGANVSGSVANATYANIAGVANSVAGANVSGTVANATFATTAGTANSATVAASANSVALANVSGAGNIASINLTGSSSNVLYGNGVFAPVSGGNTANANYANFAGTAFSVSGSNVTGTVANANFATSAGTANSATVAASANSVAGANVSGTVGNANIANNITILQDFGNTSPQYITYVGANTSSNQKVKVDLSLAYIPNNNILSTNANGGFHGKLLGANSANPNSFVSVSGASGNITANINGTTRLTINTTGANVNGNITANNLGNIASVNLNGNASTVLDGTGNWVTVSSGANANYANFAGDVVNATQSNITSVGNLVSLTVNANVANSTTVQVDGTLITTPQGDAYQVIDAHDDGNGMVGQTSTTKTLNGFTGGGYWEEKYYANDGTNTASAGFTSFDYNDVIGNASSDPLIPGSYTISTYTTNSNLADAGTGTGSSVLIGNPGLTVTVGTPSGAPVMQVNHYGDQGLRFNTRNGNSDARTNVAADGYLGNVEWRGAGLNGSGAVSYNTKPAYISAKVDSAYTGANAETLPTGVEIAVVNSSNTQVVHSFYANGDVNINGNLSATNLGNIVSINLDGSSSNVLYGNGVWAAAGGGGDANFANYAGNVTVSSQGNITSLGNLVSLQVGNGAANTATTTFTPVGANITTLSGDIFVNNTRISYDDADVLANFQATQDAIINPYDTANLFGQSYQLNYLVQDLANTANIATAGTDTFNMFDYGAGNAAATGERTLSIYTADSDLATANPNTTLNIVQGAAGLFINRQMPNDVAAIAGSGLLSMMNYGELSDPTDATGIVMNRRRGNNSGSTSTRDPVQSNDYLGNIVWRGAGTATGTINSGRASIGAKVDSSYGGPGNVMPIGMEMVVIDSSNTALTHSFYANGDVSFAGNILSNIPASTSIVNGNSSVSFTGAGGDLLINVDNTQYATFYNNRRLQLNGIEADSSNASQFVMNNGGIQLIQEDLAGGFASFDFKSYYSTGFIAPYTFYRARGNAASPTDVQAGDAITTQSYIAYGDSGNTFVNVGTYSATVTANDGAGNVQSRIEIATNRNDNGSEVKLNADVITLQGNSVINLNANDSNVSGNLNVTGNITYDKTFGSFTSNVTQTNSNVGNAIYMTLNNDEGSNGVSIVSNSQITIAKPGRYNLQFSAQLEKTDTGTDEVEVWLTKNGTAVANSATRLAQQGNNVKGVAAWNWLLDATTANTYYQIAWGSTDANMQLVAIDSANTLSGVAVPSLIVTVVPVGA